MNEFLNNIKANFNATDLSNELQSRHDEYLTLVQAFVQENTHSNEFTNDERNALKKAICSIIYLFIAMKLHYSNAYWESDFDNGFELNFKSQIPIEAGLGSSASYGVCVAAISYIYAFSNDQPGFVETFNETASDEERLYFNELV